METTAKRVPSKLYTLKSLKKAIQKAEAHQLIDYEDGQLLYKVIDKAMKKYLDE